MGLTPKGCGLLLVVAGIFAFTQSSSDVSADLHLGLTLPAWQEWRAGERAAAPVLTHMGLTPAAWLEYRAGEQVA